MKKNILIATYIIATLFAKVSYSQQDLTLFSCSSIPQSNFTNPIMLPDPKVHFGIPILSSMYFGVGHTGFHLHNILDVVDTNLIINSEKMVENLPKRSFINLNSSIDLLSFGLKVGKKHYFNLGITNKMYSRFGYPKNLVDFLNRASQSINDLDANINFTKTGLNFTWYNEYILGYAFRFNDRFTFGAHAKYLQGLANIHIKKSDVSIIAETKKDYLTLSADIDAYATMPGSSLDFSNYHSIIDYATQMKNKGLAFDFGASFNLTHRLSFGASVIDLGYIDWTSGTKRFKSVNPDSKFTFEGANFTDFFFGKDGDTTNLLDRVNNFIDTLSAIFKVDTLYETYRTPLNTYINFHLFYDINKNNRLSVLVRNQFYLEALHTSLSLGYTTKIGKILTLGASYSISNRKYDNFGFVLATRFGKTQFYITTDNLPIFMKKFNWGDNFSKTFSVPKNTKYFNIHYGVNILFGDKNSYD